MGSRASRTYFSVATVAFLLSYVVMDSSKWTNNIFYAFMALPGVIFLIKERGAQLLQQPLAWMWLVFLLWFLVPAGIAGNGQFYKHVLYVGLFIYVIAALVEPGFFRSSLFVRGMFWILCAYIYGFAAYAYMTGLYAVGQRIGLLPSRLENVIYTSIWLLCALALAFPLWLQERRRFEAISAVVLSLVGVAFVLQTRTALVGAAFLTGVWALYGIWRFPKYGVTGLIAGALVAGVTFWVIHDEAWYIGLMARGDSFRIELFQVMTGEWRDCGWLLGCGVEFKTTKMLGGVLPIQHPHNIFVALGLYTGGVSLVLFVVLMAATLLQAWRSRDPWGLFLAAALVMLNFDGSKLIGNPDELWPLVLLPAAVVMGRAVQGTRRFLT